MFQYTGMNYVKMSAPAELTLVEWRASRLAAPRAAGAPHRLAFA